MILTRTELRAIRTAARRTPHFLCPIPGVHAASETAVLSALRNKGLATHDPSPVLTDDGLKASEAL